MTKIPVRLLTDPAYQGAYYVPQQNHAESQCWEPCGKLGKSMEHARVVPEMTASLIAKLVTLVHYVDIQRQVRLMNTAELVRDRLLDDPEIAAWVDANKNNLLYNVRHPR